MIVHQENKKIYRLVKKSKLQDSDISNLEERINTYKGEKTDSFYISLTSGNFRKLPINEKIKKAIKWCNSSQVYIASNIGWSIKKLERKLGKKDISICLIEEI